MGKHFISIRKKTRLFAAVAAAMLGLGVGLFAVSIFLFGNKLLGLPFMPLGLIAGGGAFLVTGALAYLLFMPSERRLAKRLDEEHNLEEKMRTMVAYKNDPGIFAKLQREDADEKLGRIKIRFWRKGQLISVLLALLLSLSCLGGAVLVPDRHAGELEKPISDFDRQYILADLTDLINTVTRSLMTEELKQDALNELNALYTFVEEHELLSEMKTQAISAVLNINASLKRINIAPPIGTSLSLAVTPKLKELGEALSTLNGPKAKSLLGELQEQLNGQPEESTVFIADELQAALNQAGADNTLPLTRLISNLASALRNYADQNTSLEAAFGNIPFDLSNEVMLQSINKMTMQTVISRLCTLFGITDADLEEVEGGESVDIRPPAEPPKEEEGDDAEEPDKDIGAGSVGTGDRVYGSNDMIYNPYTNTYVPYGQILDEYNASAIEKLADGRIPEDFSTFVEAYFKKLSDYQPENSESNTSK